MFIGKKLLPVVQVRREEDSIPKQEEEDTDNSAQHFFDFRVGLKQLTHMADCNFKFTIILEAGCEVCAK